jgi:hypothetical protein
MRIIGRFLAGLLVITLLASVGAWVMDRTVGNAEYLQTKVDQTQLADKVARELPTVLGRMAGGGESQVILEQTVTPQFVRQQLAVIVPSLVAHYRDGGPAPTLNLRPLRDDIVGQDYVLPPALAATLQTQQAVTPRSDVDSVLQTGAGRAKLVLWLGPLAAIVLAALIFLLGGHHRWGILAGACLGGAIGVVALAGLAQLPPNLVASTLATSPAKELEAPIKTFMSAIAKDQTTMLLWAAGALAALAVALVFTHFIFHLLHKVHRKHDHQA